MLRANRHHASLVLVAAASWVGPIASRTAPGERIGPPPHFLRFNGSTSYVEVPSAPELGVGSAGLTVAMWMRPDAVSFPKTEGSRPTDQYVHWLGKGEAGKHEWTFRMYSQSSPPGPRVNRISFYVFNLAGGRGCGSYFQDDIEAGQWIQVVGVVDPAIQHTAIYKNGELRHQDNYGGIITPASGSAPLGIGTKDFASFFKGAIGPIYLWRRALSGGEVRALYTTGRVPPNGLVAGYPTDDGRGAVLREVQGQHVGAIHDAEWGQGAGAIASGNARQ